MTTEALEQAYASTRRILANVKPDQLDDPTPCASWTVRRLISHIVGGAHWFGISTEAGASPENGTTEDVDYTQGDMVASYDEGMKRTIAAFNAPGAQEKVIKLPFGEFPGAAFMGLATTDTFQHGWDLARATGQSTDIEPELAAQLLEGAQANIPEQFRGADGVMPFGPIQAAPAGATKADQLAAFMGRKV
jgi:uncharacterized protein (TIGR03086 family)